MAGLLAKTTARVTGRAIFEGRDLLAANQNELRQIRGNRIGFIFQDPQSSLNPVLTVGYQVSEALRVHQKVSKAKARDRAAELLDLVGIAEPRRRLRQYPHEFSGGMRQRVMIAAAISTNPSLLIADEPTTALDVTVQAQILELLRGLQRELGMSTILISHDLGVVAGLVDRVMVMYAGRPVEIGGADRLLSSPLHPYTQGLLSSVPRLDNRRGQRLEGIPGRLPDPTVLRPGCDFRDRCSLAFGKCETERPPLMAVGSDRFAACWLSTTPEFDSERPR
jgi:oligopeptide/dipeptide ABC transporter ATP-binding protein